MGKSWLRLWFQRGRMLLYPSSQQTPIEPYGAKMRLCGDWRGGCSLYLKQSQIQGYLESIPTCRTTLFRSNSFFDTILQYDVPRRAKGLHVCIAFLLDINSLLKHHVSGFPFAQLAMSKWILAYTLVSSLNNLHQRPLWRCCWRRWVFPFLMNRWSGNCIWLLLRQLMGGWGFLC